MNIVKFFVIYFFSAGAGIFSLRHCCIQTGSGSQPATYPMGSGVPFPTDKAAGA